MHRRTDWAGAAFLAGAFVASGCQQPLDTDRESAGLATLGADIHYTACQRFASDAFPEDVSGGRTKALCRGEQAPTSDLPSALFALSDDRPRLVPALDATLPEATHEDLRALLVEILPLYEGDELLPTQTRALAIEMARAADDPALPGILGRFSHRRGYRPAAYSLGLARPMLAYPALGDVVRQVLGATAPGGAGRGSFVELLRIASLELATAAPDPESAGQPTDLELTRELLFRTDPAFATGTPRLALLRDRRGLALPSPAGAVPAPFVDLDADGLADVDALDRFVDASGAPLDLPPPFRPNGEAEGVARDPAGRALRDDTTPYFQTIDLDPTLGAALVRELAALADPARPALVDATYGLLPLLGPTASRTETYGTLAYAFDGPDPAGSPLFDGLHGGGSILWRQETLDVLEVTRRLAVDFEGPFAGLVNTALVGDARADAHPEAALAQPNILWDEVLAAATSIARSPGTPNGQPRAMEALLRVLDDPATRAMQTILPAFATHRDPISFDPANVNAAIPSGDFTVDVDRSAADTADNESLLQRSLHLIADLDGVEFCNKEGATVQIGLATLGPYARCDMVRMRNVGQAFAQAILGRYQVEFTDPTLAGLAANATTRAVLDAQLESNSGITGFTTRPTPEALARFVFAPRNAWLKNQFDDPLTGDGVPIEDRHCLGRAAGDRTTPCPNAIVFAWEKPIPLPGGGTMTFLDALVPLLTALDDADVGTDFTFGELSSALHRHWASRGATRTQRTDPAGPSFSYQDDVRSYEPLIAEIVRDGGLFESASTLVTALDSFEVRTGVDGVDAMAAAAEVLLVPELSCPGGDCATDSLTYRDGRDHVCWNDGRCFDGVANPRIAPSPVYLLLDALAGADRAFEAAPARRDAWRSARSAIVDRLFTVQGAPATPTFVNPRARPILANLLDFVRDRIEAHRGGGDAEARAWVDAQTADLIDALSAPIAGSALALSSTFYEDTETRATFAALLASLLSEGTADGGSEALLLSLTDALFLLEDDATIDPLLHALAPAFAADVGGAIAGGGPPTVEGSLVDASTTVLHAIDARDTNRALSLVLRAAVTLPTTGDPESPLETIGDVIGEVNRAAPGAGGPMDAADWVALFRAVEGFSVDDQNGLERLYAVVQNRRLP